MNNLFTQIINKIFPKRFIGYIYYDHPKSQLILFEKQGIRENKVYSECIENESLLDQLSLRANAPEQVLLVMLFKTSDISTTEIFISPGLKDEAIRREIQRGLPITNTDEEYVQYERLHQGDFEDTIKVSVLDEHIIQSLEDSLGQYYDRVIYIGSGEHCSFDQPSDNASIGLTLPMNHVDKEQYSVLKKHDKEDGMIPWLRLTGIVLCILFILLVGLTIRTAVLLNAAEMQFETKQVMFQNVEQLKKENTKTLSELNLLKKVQSRKSTIAYLLYQLEKAIPKEVTFTSLKINQQKSGYQTTITGNTTAEPALYNMLKILEENPDVGSVQLENITRNKKEYAQFVLEVSFYE